MKIYTGIDNNELQALAKKAYEIAAGHGFHDERKSVEHWLMLVITEIGEMVDADRKMKRAMMSMYDKNIAEPQPENRKKEHRKFCFETFVKNSIEDEMADVFIRLLDLAGDIGMVFDKYNEIQYHREWQKYRFTENAFALVKALTKETYSPERRILFGLQYIHKWAFAINVDLMKHVELKMQYNAERERLHGKKY